MKILVGVDDSPHSSAAIQYVKRMPWPAGTEVIVISAVPPVMALYTEVYVPASTQLEQVLEDQIKYHDEIASRAEASLRESGLKTQHRVLEGDPREVLLETAKLEAADLIVVGSHGRSGLSKLVMGSVAAHVVTHAPCSVLVVRLGAKNP
jgi:nucleotide-binding universal stress UspA family protein